MTSFALVFLQQSVQDALTKVSEILSEIKHEPGFDGNIYSASATAELAAAQSLLNTMLSRHLQSEDDAFSVYLDKISEHLEAARNWATPKMFEYPGSEDSILELRALSATSPLASVWAEALLGALAWWRGDHASASALVGSALTKAKAIAEARPASVEQVEESESFQIQTAKFSQQRTWSYRGLRPVNGSAAHLAQDLEVALNSILGQDKSPADVYRQWLKVVDVVSGAE